MAREGRLEGGKLGASLQICARWTGKLASALVMRSPFLESRPGPRDASWPRKPASRQRACAIFSSTVVVETAAR